MVEESVPVRSLETAETRDMVQSKIGFKNLLELCANLNARKITAVHLNHAPVVTLTGKHLI